MLGKKRKHSTAHTDNNLPGIGNEPPRNEPPRNELPEWPEQGHVARFAGYVYAAYAQEVSLTSSSKLLEKEHKQDDKNSPSASKGPF